MAQAKRPSKEKSAANLLRVASLLLKDGHADRAVAVLAEIDRAKKGLNKARLHTLGGLIALKRKDRQQAVREFEAAIAAGQKNKNVQVLLAQARFGLADFKGALKALAAAGKLATAHPRLYLLRAQCYWRTGDRAAAWTVLGASIVSFPRMRELRRQKVLLMVDLGLYRAATRAGLAYLASAGVGKASARDTVAIAEALRRGKQHKRAILVLEQARMFHPKDEAILRQLAKSYLDDGKPLSAAGLLARAARLDPALHLEAAELYRRGGKLLSALYENSRATSQKKKVRQRLGLLIELQRHEQAVALAPRLSRLGLLADQQIVYALAYACFKSGRFAQTERWLQRIDEPALFDKAVALRRAMQSCRALGWSC